MKVRIKYNIVARYELALPGELAACDDTKTVVKFLESIEGREVNLVFTHGDAFEEKDNNVWLPDSLWIVT